MYKIAFMKTLDRFTEEVIERLRQDVIEAGENEVFWAGKVNDDGIVVSVETGARGNEDSVIVNWNTAREGHVLIHNHPGGNLNPSEADQSIAYNASDSCMGFYIINNEATEVYVVVEPVLEKKTVKLDPEDMAFYLSENGPLAETEGYDLRPSQIELVKKITGAFNESKIAAFEAGTGVGKSFAYLIPSIEWALLNKERVVVSTGTINLQQQLFEKDIPRAQKITGKKIKAILLKGRQNYVCLRRLNDAAGERDLFSEDTEIFDSIYEWAQNTRTGSKSDLTFMPSENVWSRINSESDGCMGARCPYREKCFVMQVRKQANDANLIIVNHHLLFADIESRMEGAGYEDTAVLPPYRRVVFDEAHGMEDSATSFFSEVITRFKVTKQINLMFRSYRGSMAGFLVQAAAVSSVSDFTEKAMASVNQIKDDLINLEESALESMGEEYTARITVNETGRWTMLFAAFEKFCFSLNVFITLVREVLDGIAEEDSEIPAVWETKTVLRRLEGMASLSKNFVSFNEHEDTVFWIQRKTLPPKKSGDDFLTFMEFYQTPLDIAPLMNKGVFEPLKTVVCTSATLRTGQNFGYWLRRTGISFVEDERVEEGVFESPFPYKTNVLFGVPSDAPFPSSEYFQSYVEETVPKLIEKAGGRTLVLFTSYDSLRNTYSNTRMSLAMKGITVLKQGDDDRFRLLERFKEERESVLYATDSFWEGVDVPGDSLSQVIIVKLPFAVPNDPVFEARSEAVSKKGGSPFFELSVPQAVIKFRQGFGRLIRRSQDKGVIMVLDRRIVEKNYGRQFTTSVPMSRRMYNPLNQIIDAMTDYL